MGGVKDWEDFNLPKCSLDEVNEAMYFEVHVLVEGKELDSLKHIKYVHLSNVHVHHILKRKRKDISHESLYYSLPLSLSLPLPPSSLFLVQQLTLLKNFSILLLRPSSPNWWLILLNVPLKNCTMMKKVRAWSHKSIKHTFTLPWTSNMTGLNQPSRLDFGYCLVDIQSSFRCFLLSPPTERWRSGSMRGTRQTQTSVSSLI